MTREQLAEFARHYLESRGFEVSGSTPDAIASSRYLNPDHLSTLDDDTIEAGAVVVLSDAIEEFGNRKEKSPTVRKIRDIDLRPALRRRFCTLPPFCK